MSFFQVVAAKPGRVEVSMAQGETEARRIEHVLGVRRHRILGRGARVVLALCGAPIVCLMASARPSPVQNIAPPVAPAAAPLPEPSGATLPAPASAPPKSVPRARQIPALCFGACGPAAIPLGPAPPSEPPIEPVAPSSVTRRGTGASSTLASGCLRFIGSPYQQACGRCSRSVSNGADDKSNERGHQETVQPIHKPAMARDQSTRILGAEMAFDGRFK